MKLLYHNNKLNLKDAMDLNYVLHTEFKAKIYDNIPFFDQNNDYERRNMSGIELPEDKSKKGLIINNHCSL